MMKGLYSMVDLLNLVLNLTQEEKDFLLEGLVVNYAAEVSTRSYFMDVLMKGDLKAFQESVAYYVNRGLSVRACIQCHIDYP